MLPSKHQLYLTASTLLAGLGLGAAPALAQTATVPAAETPGTDATNANPAPGEIVVTANKSKEIASRVPISIVALSGDALKASGVKGIVGLAQIAPGVQFDQVAGLGAGTNTSIAIRGINSSIGTSTTGIYLDDTALQTRVASLSYFGNPYPAVFDLERVEVERGPQGTLFGAGAEGGAVRFITTEPSLTTWSGTARVEGAATEKGGPSYEAGFATGGPLVADKLGIRASVWGRRDGGYVDRVSPFTGAVVDRNADRADTFSGRVALLWQPVEGVRITPSFLGQVNHSNDTSSYFESYSDNDKNVFRNARLTAQPSTDRLYLGSLKIEADVSDAVSLTSVSSYMVRNGHGLQDGTGTNGVVFGGYGYGVPEGGNPADYQQYWAIPTDPSQAAYVDVTTRVKTFSQEVRLANNPGTNLKWTLGAYYSRAVQTDYQLVYGPWVMANIFGAENPDDPMLNSQIKSIDTQAALFGQIDYKITPDVTFTLGGRISHAIAGYTQTQSGILSSTGSNAVATASGEQKQWPWSGKIGLAWQVTPSDMLYASASRGYRMGGANQPINSAPASQGGCGLEAPPTYGSDKVNSYEAGWKGRALGGKLRVDADVYWVDWMNIQTSLYFACAFGYITNAGNGRTKGFDLALRYQATPELTLNFAATYTHAAYRQNVYLPLVPPGSPGSLVVAAGDKLAGLGSAPWNLTGGFDYTATIGANTLRWHVEDLFRSRDGGHFPWQNADGTGYAPALTNNPATNQLNTRLTYSIGKTDIALFVNNVLNSTPRLYRYQDAPTSGQFYALTFRPRTFGASVDYRF